MYNINDRRLIEGESNNLMQVYPLKHKWTTDVLEKMIQNNWNHKQDDITDSFKEYQTGKLNSGNLSGFKKALAFLSNLDGIQYHNLTGKIGKYITSPEVSMCITRQAWEEVVHVMAYADIIETYGFTPEEVYWLFETDGMLAIKNKHITDVTNLLGFNYSPQNFVKAVVANIALEGIYFFNGFMFFFNLDRQGLQRGVSNRIKHISRDEITHKWLFINMWFTLKDERPELFTPELVSECKEIITTAVDYETTWGKYIIQDGVLGLTDSIMEQYPRHLANEIWTTLSNETIYHDEKGIVIKNPSKWMDNYLQLNSTDTNFFEQKVLNYESDSLEW